MLKIPSLIMAEANTRRYSVRDDMKPTKDRSTPAYLCFRPDGKRVWLSYDFSQHKYVEEEDK